MSQKRHPLFLVAGILLSLDFLYYTWQSVRSLSPVWQMADGLDLGIGWAYIGMTLLLAMRLCKQPDKETI